MSIFVYVFLTKNPYANADPVDSKLIDDYIKAARTPQFSAYLNEFCSKSNIRLFKGTVLEWCVIETLVFCGLNIS